MCMFTYATPTFTTEVHCLVTQVKLLLTTVTVNKSLIQCQLILIGLASTTCINAKAMPINDNSYSCHITAVELVLICINSDLCGAHSGSPHLVKYENQLYCITVSYRDYTALRYRYSVLHITKQKKQYIWQASCSQILSVQKHIMCHNTTTGTLMYVDCAQSIA